MRLRIAGIGCELVGVENVVPSALERYAPFASTVPPLVRVKVARQEKAALVEPGWEQPMVLVEPMGGRTRLRLDRIDNPFAAELDLARGLAHVELQDNVYCLDSFLRVLYSILLADSGGLLLHAAAVVCDGRAMLLPGKSEAGKTTLCRQGFVETLSDELVAVVPRGGKWLACGTPFWGEAVAGQNAAWAEVAGVYLLRKGSRHEVRELERWRALVEVLGCCLFFGPRAMAPDVFATCSRLLEDHLQGELAFRPDPSVVRFMTEEAMRYAS